MSKKPRVKYKSFAAWMSQNITRITMIVFLIAILAVSFVSVREIYEESSLNSKSSLNNSILDIEKSLTKVETTAETIAWMIESYEGKSGEAHNIVKELLQSDSIIFSCSVAYEPFNFDSLQRYFMVTSYRDESTGEVISELKGGEDYDYPFLDWYQIPRLTGEPYWNDPSYDETGTSGMVTTYSFPLHNSAGEFFGVLRCDVSLDWIAAIIDRFKPYESAVTCLIGHNGSFITHRDKEKVLKWTIFTDALDQGSSLSIDKCKEVIAGKTGDAVYPYGGKLIYAVYAPMQNGWRALGLCSFKDFFKSAKKINVLLFIIAFFGLLALYFASRKVISRLTKPITEFTYSAMNMSRGNFDASIPEVKTEDEMKQLSLSLRYLQSSIKRYISELRDTTTTKERIESELNIASGIQMAMLPQDFPQDERFDCYATLTPAKEVGGDLYDFRLIGDVLYFSVGDVSGKGVPAALFMAITTSSFSFVQGMDLGPSGVMSKINNTFAENNKDGMFVTLYTGKLHLDTLELEFCNGGHNPIVIVNPDGTAKFLKAKPNLAVGLFEDFPYQGETVQLEKGSRLIIYTDGITEAEDRKKNLFGDDRLLEFASHLGDDMTSREVTDNLMAEVRKFTDGNEQNDDMTIMSIKLT